MTKLVPVERIEQKIYLIRKNKVMLDSDLAELYGVKTKELNKAVKRNIDRFPSDFAFQLTYQEFRALRFQIGTLETGRGKYSKYLRYVFTEQGVAMLSGLLQSKRAVAVNVAIMRTFVKLRKMIASHKVLSERLDKLEKRYDHQFKMVFDAIRELMTPPPPPKKRKMGF